MISLARLYVAELTAKAMGLSGMLSHLISAWITLDLMDDVGSFLSLLYVPSSSMHSNFSVYSFLSMTTVKLPLFAGRITMSLSLRSSLAALHRWLGRFPFGGLVDCKNFTDSCSQFVCCVGVELFGRGLSCGYDVSSWNHFWDDCIV